MRIGYDGNVGIGTTSPSSYLAGTSGLSIYNATVPGIALANSGKSWLQYITGNDLRLYEGGAALDRVTFQAGGNVGIGTTGPDNTLSVNGTADKASGGTTWGTFSDIRLKNVDGPYTSGLAQIMQLQPVMFHYKPGNPLGLPSNEQNYGFIAQDVQKVMPEAVIESSNGYLQLSADQILWSMVNAIKEQQGEIASLSANLGSIGSRMTIDNTGNVGIGTAGPAAKLDISMSSAGTALMLDQTGTVTTGTNTQIGFRGDVYGSWYGSIRTNVTNASDGTSQFIIANRYYTGSGYGPWDALAIGGPGASGDNRVTALGSLYSNGYTFVGQYLNVGLFTTDSPGGTMCKRSYDNYIGLCTSLTALKDNITPLDLGLDTLMKLRPVQYDWKQPAGSTTVYPDLGFLAEDVQAVNPLLAEYDNGKLIGVEYEHMSALIVKAIQEQQGEIASLSGSLANLVPVAMTDTGDLSLNDQNASDTGFTVPHYYSLNDALGNPLQRVGEFSDAAIANLKVGLVNAQQVTTNALSVTTENITINGQNIRDYITGIVQGIINSTSNNVVSPIASADEIHTNFVSPVDNTSNIALDLGDSKLTIRNGQNASSSAVVVIDNQGNASFSGQLSSNSLNTNEATISGTLHVGKIIADQIVGASNSASVTNVTNIYNSTPSGNFPVLTATLATGSGSNVFQQLNSFAANHYIDISSYSGQLAYVNNLSAGNAAFSQGLMVFGQTSLSDTSIVGQLSIDGNLILANDSVNVLGSDLNLQPLRQGGLSVMAGLFYIDTDGNLKVGGNANFAKNVTVNGTLAVGIISPLPGNNLNVNLGSNGSSFAVNGASNSAILSVNPLGDLVASGAATIAKLNLSLVQPALAVSPTEVVATGSAGTASITAYNTQVTIDNPSVTAKSLIYITPTSSTNNQVLYLLRQVPGLSFTVGLQNPSAISIPFNWIIVN